MQQSEIRRKEGARNNEYAALNDRSLGLAMSQAHRQVNMSQQRVFQTSQASVSNATQLAAQIRLPQHHQVAPIAPALSIPAHGLVSSQAQQLAHLQRLPNMQQHAFNMYRPPMPKEAIFKVKKLRSGKWTPEEEAYADVLIELFVKGQVDLENGSTLRSFLAKKLHCAPMRVTKKYAGKSKGKASYLGKKNSVAIDPVGYQRNMTRLQTAKRNFLKAVYPELSVTRKATPLGVGPQIQPLIVPLLPNPNSNTASWSQYSFPSSNLTMSSSAAPYAVVSGKSSVEISSRPSIAVVGRGNSTQFHRQPPQPSAPNADTKSQTLHESFLNAVQKNSVTQSQPTRAPTVKPHPTELLHNAYVTATEATGMRPPASFIPGATRTTIGPPELSTGSHISSSGNVPQVSEMPDFLKGFDKVAEMKSSSTPGANTSEQHTPTFTSKSFDDFHRLLGVNLSPIGSGAMTNGKPSDHGVQSDSTAQHHNVTIPAVGVGVGVGHLQQRCSGNEARGHQTSSGNTGDPDLLAQAFKEAMSQASSKQQRVHHLGADYYNMFAQQTALAASQHSAYLGGRENDHENFNQTQVGPSTTGSMRNATVVSEPSTTSGSDRGTEESDETGDTTSGVSDTASSSNDSDSNSWGSSRQRKKARMASGKRIQRVSENQTVRSNNR